MIIWGISWPSTKVLSHYTIPLNLAAIRFVFISLTVGIIVKLNKIPFRLSKEATWPLVIASCLISLYNFLFFTGIEKGKPGAAGVLVTTITPLITYFLGAIINKKKFTTNDKIGLLFGIIGGIFLLHTWDGIDSIFAAGNVYFLCCTFVWAFLSRTTAKSKLYGHPFAFTFWMYCICACILVCACNIPECITVLQKGDTIFWGNMLFNSIINAGMATLFYFFATSQLGAERTSSFTFIVPCTAAISSYLILGEHIYWYTIVGGIIGLIAVFLLNIEAIKKLNK
jgi:drug/metabolite transporter (DMT)-like permease